jgi:hypothetical protein
MPPLLKGERVGEEENPRVSRGLRGETVTSEISNTENLWKAARDFRYLLDHGYSRKASLELVGNRFQLFSDQRQLLHRGIFSDPDSKSRRRRKISIERIRGKDLAIDGYNVIITIEAGLSGRPLISGSDGFIRDISGLSGNFRRTSKTGEAIRLIIRTLKKMKPQHTLFLFDAPISNSGKLAQEVRGFLKKANLPGDAQAIRVPEEILIGFPGVIATSDTAIIDRSRKVVDLAGTILCNEIGSASLIRWKRK